MLGGLQSFGGNLPDIIGAVAGVIGIISEIAVVTRRRLPSDVVAGSLRPNDRAYVGTLYANAFGAIARRRRRARLAFTPPGPSPRA